VCAGVAVCWLIFDLFSDAFRLCHAVVFCVCRMLLLVSWKLRVILTVMMKL
jgi:hypothetical protein